MKCFSSLCAIAAAFALGNPSMLVTHVQGAVAARENVLSRANVKLADPSLISNEEFDPDLDFELDLDDSSFTSSSTSDIEEIQMTSNGDMFPQEIMENKVAAKGFNYGRGVGYVTISDVKKGEQLFSIPNEEIMSLDSANRGRIGLLIQVNPDLSPAIVLALHLLNEKFLEKASKFSTFIEGLPKYLNTTLFFSQEELDSMKGSQLYRLTVGRYQALEEYFKLLEGPVTSNAVDPPLFTKEQFTLENFKWALSIVWAQSFFVGPNERDVNIMPIVNTIGECIDCENDIRINPETGRVHFFAIRDYKRGEAVEMNLGAKGMFLTMLNHGYMPPASSLDRLQISIFLDPTDPMAKIKEQILFSYNMSMNDSYLLSYGSTELAPNMLKSLRIKLLKGGEIEKYTQAAEDKIISLRNEFVVSRAIIQTCDNLLQQYQTSILEDKQKKPRNQREESLLKILIIEKEILENTKELATKQWMKLLDAEEAVALL
jgi:hypothetical protein